MITRELTRTVWASISGDPVAINAVTFTRRSRPVYFHVRSLNEVVTC
jgi:hypothetical protein